MADQSAHVSAELVTDLAAHLDAAVLDGETVAQLTLAHPQLDVTAAYEVQRAGITLRAARGDHLVGMKMGLTSRAKMAQVGVHEPIYAHLTKTMRLPQPAELRCADFGHPRAEPEVAFTLAQDLSGPVTPVEALQSVATVHAALEVIDSRYRDFKFALADVVADNASSCRFVVGEGRPLASLADEGLALDSLAVTLSVDGRPLHEASTAAILGDPAESLAFLANMLAERGERLRAGMIVLAGAATAAVHLLPGMTVRAKVHGLANVDLQCR